MKALTKFRAAGELLQHFGIENPLKDAELIIVHCLGVDRVKLYRDNPEIDDDALSLIDALLRRRSQREPLQYILGYTEFHGLTLQVGPGILIPRPETELLVDEAIQILKSKMSKSLVRILDLCTGSGCIAIALAKEFPDAEVYGTDTSERAVLCAAENAGINTVLNAAFVRGSFFEPIHLDVGDQLSGNAFDLIISNPPYIRSGDIRSLQPEIKDWEPADALDGGEDGLDYFRIIIPEAKNYLRRNGFLMFEIGIDQAEAVNEIARVAGYAHNDVRKDYAGIDRIIVLWT